MTTEGNSTEARVGKAVLGFGSFILLAAVVIFNLLLIGFILVPASKWT